MLEKYGINPKKFWLTDAKKLISLGYDPQHAYLKLILDNVGMRKPLGKLTNDDLRKFGKEINKKFYPGLAGLFRDLKTTVEQYRNIDIAFYVISGGIQEIIEGTTLISENFNGVYASQLAGDTEDGILKYIKRCVTFTEKTRYIFEISKGIPIEETRINPYLVNKDVPMDERPVPFSNMVYIGDGLTDIPCFSLIKEGIRDEEGGIPFAVFDPAEVKSAKRALQEFLQPGRVYGAFKPRYRKNNELGSLIRTTVAERCHRIGIRLKEVRHRQ